MSIEHWTSTFRDLQLYNIIYFASRNIFGGTPPLYRNRLPAKFRLQLVYHSSLKALVFLCFFLRPLPALLRKRRSPIRLSAALKDVISSYGIDTKLFEGKVVATWQDIAGERIGQEVEKLWVKDSKLFVRIKSPVWRQELYLNRDSWCRRLNEEMGENRVEEIVFR